MQRIAREPAQRKSRRIGPPDNHRTGLAQIRYHEIVLLRDQILLQAEPIGGGIALLVHIHLDGNGHASKRSGILTTRDHGINARGIGECFLWPVIHNGIDFGVHRGKPCQRILRGFGRRDLLTADTRRQVGCIQAP